MASGECWKIEGRRGSETIFETSVPGFLTQKEIVTLLQRLVAQHLGDHDVVNSSLRRNMPGYRCLLEPQIEPFRPDLISVGENPYYLATFQHRVE